MIRTKLFLSLLFCSLASIVCGQDLVVNSITTETEITSVVVEKTRIFNPIGGILVDVDTEGQSSEPKKSVAYLIEVITEASKVRVTAENQDRSYVTITKIAGTNYYLLGKAKGKVWVRVNVMDFDKDIWDEQTIVVPTEGQPDPTPDPIDPTPDPTPDPDDDEPLPPNPDVDNEYNVGEIADKYAPNDVATKRAFAQHYRDAGMFLFGIPTLKTISSSNNPDSSVFAWLNKEAEEVSCPSPEVCAAWTVWRAEIAKGLNAEQKRRQFSRQDWFNAFLEIAEALETVK